MLFFELLSGLSEGDFDFVASHQSECSKPLVFQSLTISRTIEFLEFSVDSEYSFGIDRIGANRPEIEAPA